MKIKFTLLAFSILLFSCSHEGNQIGKVVDTQSAVSIREALKEFEKTPSNKEVVVFGKVADVCQSEGCWFNYTLGDSSITVDFNEEFTVPKTIKHKDMYAVGHFMMDTLYVDSIPNKIEKITPKFRATGVKFK